jgi:hypothetical protein
MRRLSVIVAVLLVAGCQVDVEGAPCEIPGATDLCPSGQACGQDRRCSTRASACRATMCAPDAQRCAGGVIARCSTAADPVCGAWEPQRSCDAGLVCAEGAAACACPGVTDGAYHFEKSRVPFDGIASTGAAYPAGCRFETLGEALAQAAAFGGGGRAVAAGEPAEYAIDVPPLVIPASVTLTTTKPDDPSRHVLRVSALAEAEPAVTLGAGSGLEGFTIRNEGATTGRAIDVACTDGKAALARVVVEGGGVGARFVEGVRVGATCDVAATDLSVRDVSGAGVFLDTAGTRGTELDGGTLANNGEGVHLKEGKLAIRGMTIEDNTKTGILAGEASSLSAKLDAEANVVRRNRDSGLVVLSLSSATIVGNRFEQNVGTTVRSSASRTVGGVVLRGDPPATLTFEGNVVSDNTGDQVIVYGTSSPTTTWTIDGPDCTARRNTFGCYDASFYGLVAVDCIVRARYASWQSATPTTSARDFRAFGAAQVDVGTDGPELYCQQAAACQ